MTLATDMTRQIMRIGVCSCFQVPPSSSIASPQLMEEVRMVMMVATRIAVPDAPTMFQV
ncbi:Uncharacterised protein [Mycobacterium tuberculosis]|nr:Uncharacterised protein [Mycobacterium tuberculosis]